MLGFPGKFLGKLGGDGALVCAGGAGQGLSG